MLPGHKTALDDIIQCRTQDLGGHLYKCDECGHKVFSYHSCKNRGCTTCQNDETEQWIEEQKQALLPVPYFFVTFTLPQQLREIVRSHQVVLYDILMKAAAHSIIDLARDPHYVGGLTGVMAFLHTWGRTMSYHPHVHCIIPGGGLAEQNWVPSKKKYLVPVHALSKIFRGKFMEMAKQALPNINFPESVWKTGWVVNCQPVSYNVEHLLSYLGRYVHRIAITNSRILSVENEKVIFSYKDTRDNKKKTMMLTAEEFIRRYLQHVLPKGFHRVRYYGLWAPKNKSLLYQLQLQFAKEQPKYAEKISPPAEESKVKSRYPLQDQTCPKCKKGRLHHHECIQKPERSPPKAIYCNAYFH